MASRLSPEAEGRLELYLRIATLCAGCLQRSMQERDGMDSVVQERPNPNPSPTPNPDSVGTEWVVQELESLVEAEAQLGFGGEGSPIKGHASGDPATGISIHHKAEPDGGYREPPIPPIMGQGAALEMHSVASSEFAPDVVVANGGGGGGMVVKV